MVRSILAVLAGLAVTVVLVMAFTFLAAMVLGIPFDGPPTAGYLVLNLVGGAFAGMAGGATAVRLAPHRPHAHGGALAVLILLMSLPTLLSAPAAGQPEWYGLALSAIGPLSVLLGGVFAARSRPDPA